MQISSISITRKYIKLFSLAFIFIVFSGFLPASPEEGMYPLSELNKIDFKKAGFRISPEDIYNPGSISLVDAMVNLSGCSGSFVSGEGLIITNHHCAFRAIADASSLENNYLENGFSSKSREGEIPAAGITASIIESYSDVSERVLEAITALSGADRKKKLSRVLKEIEKENTNESASVTASVAEMIPGSSYVLFVYKTLKDIRIVYAPPRSIGEFGGESDNWVWPRHTGDFTFLRAYVSEDGTSEKYDSTNVPFRPKRFLEIDPTGVSENDLVFIMGYPARTFRHRPSFFLRYQNEYELPLIQKHYAYAIDYMEELSKESDALRLKYASTIKSLANREKNYRGKLKGIRKLDLISSKVKEERELQNFINSDSDLKEKYGMLFPSLTKAYEEYTSQSAADLWFQVMARICSEVTSFSAVSEMNQELLKEDDKRISTYKEENLIRTRSRISGDFKEKDTLTLRKFMDYMFTEGAETPGIKEIITQNGKYSATESAGIVFNFLISLDKDSLEVLMSDQESLASCPKEIADFFTALSEKKSGIAHKNEEFEGTLNKLYADLTEVKMLWDKRGFIPDANRTMRLTYGEIKGYSPADAMEYKPLTTLAGVLEKSHQTGDYYLPDNVKATYQQYLADDKNPRIPVAMLYNTDTSGGNSGSPVLNSEGKLVGVNFDRAFEATINDFAWDDSYSRSIGVDIRYVLWVVGNIGDGTELLKELGTPDTKIMK